MADEPRVLLTVEAAADRLAVGRTSMFALVKSGAVGSVMVGRYRRVPLSELDAYVAQLMAVSDGGSVEEEAHVSQEAR